MSLHWTAILNPTAGAGRAGRDADAALDRLRRGGLSFDVLRTTRPGQASELARTAFQEGVRRFVAIGGDGTTFEVLNGLVPASRPDSDHDSALSSDHDSDHRSDLSSDHDPRSESDHASGLASTAPESRPKLAILPLGTGNSFLRDFEILDLDAASRALFRDRVRSCDILKIEHQAGVLYALNIVGIGFSATAGALTNTRFKRYGKAGYLLAVAQTTLQLQAPLFPLRIDGGPIDARPAILLSFCNSKCTAGAMKMAPHADVSDGLVDIIRIGPRSRASFAGAFPSIFAGTHLKKDGVEETRARRVDFEIAEPIDCMIDGEIRSLQLRSIEVLPRAIDVIS